MSTWTLNSWPRKRGELEFMDVPWRRWSQGLFKLLWAISNRILVFKKSIRYHCPVHEVTIGHSHARRGVAIERWPNILAVLSPKVSSFA